jgi:hypothetical protein
MVPFLLRHECVELGRHGDHGVEMFVVRPPGMRTTRRSTASVPG